MNDYSKIASAYADNKIDGTVLLAYRDLPRLIGNYVRGSRAVDFGCGSGKSTRFLQGLGFQVTAVDISPAQVELARVADPNGDYRLIERGTFQLPVENADLALSVFVFLEMASRPEMISAAQAIHNSLAQEGVFFLIVATEDFYAGKWLSLDVDFPENRNAKSGDEIRVRFTDTNLTISDYYWTDEDYTAVLMAAGFQSLDRFYPLGSEKDGLSWRDEQTTAPFVIYVARKLP